MVYIVFSVRQGAALRSHGSKTTGLTRPETWTNMDLQNQFLFASETTIRIRNKHIPVIMISLSLQMRSSAHEGKKEPPLLHKYNCLFPFPSSDPTSFKLRRSTLPLPRIISYSPPVDSLHDVSSNAKVRVMSCFPDTRCA